MVARQAALIAQWMNVGFIHGVMNTDNMTISGETIDYGPCAFMEAYDPATVFSSIDQYGRYAYGNQPGIASWNLARFAETLLPLLSDDADDAIAMATEAIAAFPEQYRRELLRGQRRKLGLHRQDMADDEADTVLAEDWLALLNANRVDFTLGWRRLADAAADDEAPLRALVADARALDAWLARWRARCASEGTGTPQGAGRSGVGTREGDARRQSDRHSAQPSGGRGARRCVRSGRSRAVSTIARCAEAAVRRSCRIGSLRGAGAGCRDSGLSDLLRYLIDALAPTRRGCETARRFS